MIIPGIKIGPFKDNWRKLLAITQTPYCEIWYRADQPEEYTSMFEVLRQKKIKVGLHFWATVGEGHLANLVYPESKILEPTLKLVEEVIHTACHNHFSYVLVHSGNRRAFLVDFEKRHAEIDGLYPEISVEEAETTQETSLTGLNQVAKKLGVLLITETVPAKDPKPWDTQAGRLNPHENLPVPVASLIKLSQKGFYIANDFIHTFCDGFDKPREELVKQLFANTKLMAPMTKVLHVNSVIPPYNGTDSHHGITDEDLATDGIVPTKPELLNLLKLFINQPEEVLAIVEPQREPVANYIALQKIISQLS